MGGHDPPMQDKVLPRQLVNFAARQLQGLQVKFTACQHLEEQASARYAGIVDEHAKRRRLAHSASAAAPGAYSSS